MEKIYMKVNLIMMVMLTFVTVVRADVITEPTIDDPTVRTGIIVAVVVAVTFAAYKFFFKKK